MLVKFKFCFCLIEFIKMFLNTSYLMVSSFFLCSDDAGTLVVKRPEQNELVTFC